jgi:hypothetical protein
VAIREAKTTHHRNTMLVVLRSDQRARFSEGSQWFPNFLSAALAMRKDEWCSGNRGKYVEALFIFARENQTQCQLQIRQH